MAPKELHVVVAHPAVCSMALAKGAEGAANALVRARGLMHCVVSS